jgi:N-acetyl-anhydromuramyl-L-alanine amidase AmpD
MRLVTHPSPNHSARVTRCVAVCLHWTGGSYASALDWCQRREAKVSYHQIIAPNGEAAVLVDPERSAWAVGVSRAPDPFRGQAGNSMTYNLALAGGPPRAPTAEAITTLVQRIREVFAYYDWPRTDRYRITGHNEWAWPRGRKVDPVGSPSSPWLDLDAIRTAVGGLR